jgi:hypothetical protein
VQPSAFALSSSESAATVRQPIAQTRGSLGIVTDGKENTVLDRFGTRDLIDQGIGEHREPRRNFAAIGPADAIGTTRPRTPHAFGIEREAEPGLIFETVALTRIE